MAKYGIRGGHNNQARGCKALIDEVVEDRKVAAAVSKYLKLLGQEVVDCTPGNCDTNADLRFGVNKANKEKCDFFVSIHFNKAYNSYNGAIGSEVCVYSKYDKAQKVVDALGKLGFKNRGQKVRTGLYELKNTNMKSMIVEVCFAEATEDVKLYKKLGADAIGKAIAEALVGKKYQAPSKPTPPKPAPAPSKPASKQLYRVRKSWADDKSQKGAYSDLDNAIAECKKHAGYKVYDSNGKQVYPQQEVAKKPVYRVKVDGVQITALSELENILDEVKKAVNAGKKNITLERV